MSNLYSQYTYDDALNMKDAGLVASSAAQAIILDVGNGLLDADLVIDVTALEIASDDEVYTIYIQGSNEAAMTDDKVIVASSVPIGNCETAIADDLAGDVVGRYVVPFRNEKNGVLYRYLRLYVLVAGTIATGINFSAFVGKDAD